MRRNFREEKQPTVMIIPMIDIMLFLLVFFLISTIYMVQTNTIRVSLPAAQNAAQETRRNIVSVTVTEDGNVLYDKDTIPNENLAAKFHDALLADADTVFVLRGDRGASYESVVRVLDIMKRSGAKHVSIATETKKGS